MNRLLIIPVLAIPVLILWRCKPTTLEFKEKIDGITLEASPDPPKPDCMAEIVDLGTEWVAVVPMAFSTTNPPSLVFDHERQWWGERQAGIKETIRMAHEAGLKVMIKPHVWVREQGWPGDFTLKNNKDWELWEDQYEKYIMQYARLAEATHTELFCVGTEFRISARERSEFWEELISNVREVYHGKMTYAANWDNYENISFWSKLDFIGVDAYFPVSEEKTPTLEVLLNNWKKPSTHLRSFSSKFDKPILFTEFGYQSIDYSADGHWKHNPDTLGVNNQAQSNAYQAIFKSFWNEPWFAGGFLWKWHMQLPTRFHSRMEKEYSPQNKPVINIIREKYTAARLIK